MGAESKIEWTHHTFNPWWGCQRVSPGCERCYAEAFAKRTGHAVWGPSSTTPRRFFGDKHWAEPLRWNASAAKRSVRERVFCASMADVFEDREDLVEHRARLFALIDATPALDWLLLTKRPENIRRLWPTIAQGSIVRRARGNVWLGTTTEDQQRADERIPPLVACGDLASVLFVSYEPALGPVDFRSWLRGKWRCSGCGLRTSANVGRCKGYCYDASGSSCDAVACPRCAEVHYWSGSSSPDVLEWIIVGGESGPGARPFDVAWARSTIEQCRAAGAPAFFKQAGSKPEINGAPLKLRDPKGGNLAELPEDLRVREWPHAV